MTQNTKTWLHGLGAAAIGGGASAVSAGVILPAIAPGTFNFHGQALLTLGAMGYMFLFNGLLMAFAYLKQSPLPTQSVEVTKQTTETSTVTVTPSEGK